MKQTLEQKVLNALIRGYVYALMTDGLPRIHCQETFCVMRDAIAEAKGWTAEKTQTYYERVAIELRDAKIAA